jgi:hypothetical protein
MKNNKHHHLLDVLLSVSLTAKPFHSGLENSSLEFSRMSPPDSRSASKAYAHVAQAVLNPRDLEASLLLKAAAKLQAVLEAWD